MVSTPTPDGSSNKVVRLCEPCRAAFDELLCDDGSAWKEAVRGDGVPHLVCIGRLYHGKWLPIDELPGLPRLYASALAGCRFCAFLREAILSEDAQDVFRYQSGKSAEEHGLHKVCMLLVWDHIMSAALAVLVTIATGPINVDLWFRLELQADTGR